jgi:hypothetical protein
MMRLAIAPKSTERNQRKTPQIAKSIIGLKIPPKITKMKKTLQLKIEEDWAQIYGWIDGNQVFIRCGNNLNILQLFGRLGRSLTSLLSSLLHEAHPHLAKWSPKAYGVGEGCLPQQSYGSIYSENQKTRMPLWA